MAYVGIDFGTTNSAVAVAEDDGAIQLVPLAGATHWRTVLYFEPGGALTAGAPALARYAETEGDGRLIQSIKSHLSSASFSRTHIFGRRWQLEDMIAAYLRQVRAASPIDLGRRAVVGRPVRYWGAEDESDDARAVSRMRDALAKAGFDDVVLDYEPVGAAGRYAAGLDHDELIVVADFGGGTTDFTAIRVPVGEVLATGGIGVSGDAFDARVIDAMVAPALGRGTRYVVDEMGGEAPVPAWLYGHLRRWHYLSFLKDDTTVRLLERVYRGARDAGKIGRLLRVVEDDLGMPLHRAVEGTKQRLSTVDATRLAMEALELDLPVERAAFEAWIADDLDAIDHVLDDVLARAGVSALDIDRVFATGGSSLVPAVRDRLRARFGEAKLEERRGADLGRVGACGARASALRRLIGEHGDRGVREQEPVDRLEERGRVVEKHEVARARQHHDLVARDRRGLGADLVDGRQLGQHDQHGCADVADLGAQVGGEQLVERVGERAVIGARDLGDHGGERARVVGHRREEVGDRRGEVGRARRAPAVADLVGDLRVDRASDRGHGIDDDRRANEVGLGARQPQREEAAEAVTDDHRPVEVVLLDIVGELDARRGLEWPRDRGATGEPGELDDVGLGVREVRDGGIPHRAGAAQPGDQDHGAAATVHRRRERGRVERFVDRRHDRQRRDDRLGARVARRTAAAARACKDARDQQRGREAHWPNVGKPCVACQCSRLAGRFALQFRAGVDPRPVISRLRESPRRVCRNARVCRV